MGEQVFSDLGEPVGILICLAVEGLALREPEQVAAH